MAQTTKDQAPKTASSPQTTQSDARQKAENKVASPEASQEDQKQTATEAQLSEELAQTPPTAGQHADTAAVQNLMNSNANSYPERDSSEEVARRMRADRKAEQKVQDYREKAAKDAEKSTK